MSLSSSVIGFNINDRGNNQSNSEFCPGLPVHCTAAFLCGVHDTVHVCMTFADYI